MSSYFIKFMLLKVYKVYLQVFLIWSGVDSIRDFCCIICIFRQHSSDCICEMPMTSVRFNCSLKQWLFRLVRPFVGHYIFLLFPLKKLTFVFLKWNVLSSCPSFDISVFANKELSFYVHQGLFFFADSNIMYAVVAVLSQSLFWNRLIHVS